MQPLTFCVIGQFLSELQPMHCTVLDYDNLQSEHDSTEVNLLNSTAEN